MVAALARQRKSRFGIAVATVLTDSPFGTPRGSFPQIPDIPRGSPRIRQDRTRGVIAILVREGR